MYLFKSEQFYIKKVKRCCIIIMPLLLTELFAIGSMFTGQIWYCTSWNETIKKPVQLSDRQSWPGEINEILENMISMKIKESKLKNLVKT